MVRHNRLTVHPCNMYVLESSLLSEAIQYWMPYGNIALNNFTTKLEVKVIFYLLNKLSH